MLNSKTSIFPILASMIFYSSATALTQVGNGDLFVRADADFEYDSNLFIRDNEKIDDFRSILLAGVGFVQEERSVLNARFELGRQFSRYFDNSEQDSEDWRSDFSLSWPNHIESDTRVQLSGGWNERTEAVAEVGRRIQTESLNLNGDLTHKFSDKVSSSFSVSLQDQKFNDLFNSGSDGIDGRQSKTKNIQITPSYQYSDKLSGNLLFQYRDLGYNQGIDVDQTGTTLALGVSGQLFPKLSGSVFFGVQELDYNDLLLGSGSTTDPFYSVDLTWQARDKTSVTLSGSSNFQGSPNGDINDRKDMNLDVSQRMSDKATLSGGVSVSKNNYRLSDRQDDSLALSGGYQYRLNSNVGLNARISYQDRSSDTDSFSYSQLFFSAGVTSMW